MTQRDTLLASIAAEIARLNRRPVSLVAIDGVDGAGKTRFADELADRLPGTVIRASVDYFHNPRAVRYAQGRDSPRGYFEDSFNYFKLKECLLDPLSRAPPGRYCRKWFDYRTDVEVPEAWKTPPQQGVLIFDGIFSHRPELGDYWDYSVFLEVSPKESVRRCIDREGVKDVSYDPGHPVHARYVQGQALYIGSCNPAARCTRRIDNEDIDRAHVIA